jgi:hypothetical protein
LEFKGFGWIKAVARRGAKSQNWYSWDFPTSNIIMKFQIDIAPAFEIWEFDWIGEKATGAYTETILTTLSAGTPVILEKTPGHKS